MQLIDGNEISSKIKLEIKQIVANRIQKGLKAPHLAAVLIGENGASMTYVNAKVKACEAVGFSSTLVTRPETISQDELLAIVRQLNDDSAIDGYIVQLPLPKHIDETAVLLAIDPKKDVDGFHPENVGRMALNLPSYLPATPFGILKLIEAYDIPTEGKNCVVVGRSHIVGLPVSILLQRNAYPGNCTVTIAHSKTKNLKELTSNADILIAALGRAEFITADMVKPEAVVIDVGITRVADESKKSGFRLAGDVHFESVAEKASFITPVPGGVGPMTIAALLLNTLQAAEK